MLTNSVIALVAILHIYFFILESFLWTKPIGLRAFGQSLENANVSRVLAMNQGLYNGFLAAGLIWGLLHPSPDIARQIEIFFLSCVVVAGVVGGVTASKKILWVQAFPAVIALVLLSL